MALNRHHWGSALDQVDTNANSPFTLGSLRENLHATRGWQIWKYCYNDEAATAWAAGNPIMRDATTTTLADGIISTGANIPRVRLLGVAAHAVAADRRSWIVVCGNAQVLSGDATAADLPLQTDATAGRVIGTTPVSDAAVAGTFGYSATALVADGTLYEGTLACPL